MHLFSFSLVTAAVLLVQVVDADFHVYRVKWLETIKGSTAYMYQFYENPGPSCEQVITTALWYERPHVAGTTLGVRCTGAGCDQVRTPRDIEQFEFHTCNNPLLPFNLYKPAYSMIGLDGKIYGNCVVATHQDYDCQWSNVKVQGRRKFYCKSMVTAAELNQFA
ncbi:hypothetical protein V8F06_014652 [Rhypophila decipiens]